MYLRLAMVVEKDPQTFRSEGKLAVHVRKYMLVRLIYKRSSFTVVDDAVSKAVARAAPEDLWQVCR